MVSFLFLMIGLAGCIQVEDSQDENSHYRGILDSDIGNNIKLMKEDWRALVFLAPLILNGSVNVSFTTQSDSRFGDVSLFSSWIAISFWEKSREVFIADSYESALLISPIANAKNAPILIYGNTTIKMLEKLQPDVVIGVGEIPTNTDFNLTTHDAIIEYVIKEEKKSGILDSYVILTNPNDCLSGLSSLFAAYHKGLIVTTQEKNVTDIKNSLTKTTDILKKETMTMAFLCVMSDSDYIPQYNTTVHYSASGTGEAHDSFVETDKYYASLSENVSDICLTTVPVGRIVLESIEKGLDYFTRIADYDYSGSGERANKALLYCNEEWTYETGSIPETYSMTRIDATLSNAGFETTTIQAPTNYLFSLNDEIYDSAFILTISDPKNWFDIEGSVLKNSVYYDLTSRAGMISHSQLKAYSGIDPESNDSWAKRLLGAGVNAYIAPAGGYNAGLPILIQMPPDVENTLTDACDPRLARHFFEELVKNQTVGEAFINAHKKYAEEFNPEDTIHATETLLAYNLYGDPAFNPYEPCNEG
jgi:hypothetical protein